MNDGKSAAAGVAKVLVVGNVATGKTCIIRRYTRNEFSSDYQTTIGVDFSLKSLSTDGVDINVQLWDIAGQERFAGLSRVRVLRVRLSGGVNSSEREEA